MVLDSDVCYRAMLSHDARFDGRFFVGVTSTRIYCRPVCSVKTPKRENCRFYSNAAAAEAAGHRPCLKCRPELAPGNAGVDASRRLAQAAASALEDDAFEGGFDAIAARLGVSARHLRRTFAAEFGVSPIAYAQTQRLLLAKRLLTDTRMSATDVAFASGFASLRRFNALFKERYRLRPLDLRKRTPSALPADVLTFELSFRPPYDWSALLAFLASRTIEGVERTGARSYARTVRVARGGREHVGWIEIEPIAKKYALRATVSSSLRGALQPLFGRIKHLTDVAADPREIARVLGSLAKGHAGTRVPGAFDGFEIAVRAVLGQQVSVKAARTLAGRFASAFGTPIETPFAQLHTIFPTPQAVADRSTDAIAALGIVGARARTILTLAQALADGSISLSPGGDVACALDALRAVPGIGEWTAQYIAMRALAWPDAFPHTDLGVIKALGHLPPKQVLAAGEAWRPWRSYAVMHLWRSLE
jgi:AraC family transcriptional regulator of adaptative response / DNA-3-methyladenine glycosylase II